MNEERNIKSGFLSGKLSNYSVEPPGDAWDNISSQIKGKNSRKYLFIALAAAAGLALAITVGISFIDMTPEETVAENQVREELPENIMADENIGEGKVKAPEIIPEQSAQKPERNSERQKLIKKPASLEEKVMLALEEVREENESRIIDNNEIIIAENLSEQQETLPDHHDALQTDLSVIDSLKSEHYLDSLAALGKDQAEVITDSKQEKSKWQIGASLSPIYSYRDASSADILQNQAVNNSESGRLAYSGGVQLSYHSSDRFTIESGLYYNKMGLAIGDFNSFRSAMDYWVGGKQYTDNSIISLSNSIGTINSTTEDVFVNNYAGTPNGNGTYDRLESADMLVQNEVVQSFIQTLNYLEIPFNLKYKVYDSDLKVLLVGGISTNLLIGNHVSANTNEGLVNYGDIQDIKTLNYSGNAGLGFIYSFSGNFSLSVEPRFRYYLNSINSPSLPTTRPYVLGIYTGVNYSF